MKLIKTMNLMSLDAAIPTAQDFGANGAGTAQDAKSTRKLEESLPPGIQIGMRTDGRRKPWFVRYGKDRKIESFVTERERNRFAKQLVDGVREEGEAVLGFDSSEWRDFKRLLSETGLSLPQLRDLALAAKGRGAVGLTVADASGRYLAIRKGDGTTQDTFLHMKKTLERWTAFAGVRMVGEIEPNEIRQWMAWLETEHKFAPITVRNYRKNLFTFFEWLRLEVKARIDNPCEVVQAPARHEVKIRVLPVADAHRLLQANRAYPIAPKLALEMFGGLRCASVERIQRDHVMADRRGIEMPAALHKLRKRHFRQGHPRLLWEWLQIATAATWDGITEKNYDDKKAEAFIRAGVSNPGNSLRHSFASYHLAAFKNPGLTGYLMQHTNIHTTHGYEGMASEQDARTYLSLTPCRVLMSLKQAERTARDYLNP